MTRPEDLTARPPCCSPHRPGLLGWGLQGGVWERQSPPVSHPVTVPEGPLQRGKGIRCLELAFRAGTRNFWPLRCLHIPRVPGPGGRTSAGGQAASRPSPSLAVCARKLPTELSLLACQMRGAGSPSSAPCSLGKSPVRRIKCLPRQQLGVWGQVLQVSATRWFEDLGLPCSAAGLPRSVVSALHVCLLHVLFAPRA